jgi:hypothetical protein
MARKYEVLTCPECGAGVRIEPTEGGTEGVCLSCDWSERGDFDLRRDIRKPIPITAFGLQDVGPLVEAGRSLLRVMQPGWAADAQRELDAALKAFEAEEDSE